MNKCVSYQLAHLNGNSGREGLSSIFGKGRTATAVLNRVGEDGKVVNGNI